MLDHIGYTVRDLAKSKAFYIKALAPLGIAPIMEVTPTMTGTAHGAVGFGENGKPYFWIGTDDTAAGHVHIAFAAENRSLVKAFYEAALAAGGTDNGPPGLRPHYHPHYYGAFALDPDGHNVEAVCHKPE
jgi:catechol 2,3-dioxygenase-like lactoylglutathione lyase family enzyme